MAGFPILPMPTAAQLGRALGHAQRAFGETLRSRVAGEDAAARGEQIWGKPGERWFAPTDPIWRVHQDAAMFVGGIAALLLQALHPGAMAGVAGHSGFRSDPWGRLNRTADYLAVTTYATIPDAEATIARVRARHEKVSGVDHFGEPYRASDPHLLRWVHVAEVFSFLAAHEAYGGDPLTPAEADTYVAQTGVPAERLGVFNAPATVWDLRRALNAYRDELRLTPAASDVVRFLLLEPPLPKLALPGYATLAAGAVAILPTWARDQLQIPAGGLASAIGRPLGKVGAAAVRWGLAGVADGRRSAPPPVSAPPD